MGTTEYDQAETSGRHRVPQRGHLRAVQSGGRNVVEHDRVETASEATAAGNPGGVTTVSASPSRRRVEATASPGLPAGATSTPAGRR